MSAAAQEINLNTAGVMGFLRTELHCHMNPKTKTKKELQKFPLLAFGFWLGLNLLQSNWPSMQYVANTKKEQKERQILSDFFSELSSFSSSIEIGAFLWSSIRDSQEGG